MTWNYRVIEFSDPENGVWRSIHQVYYDDAGKPASYATSPATVITDCHEVAEEPEDGLRWQLDRMREALDKPVLHEADFKRGT